MFKEDVEKKERLIDDMKSLNDSLEKNIVDKDILILSHKEVIESMKLKTCATHNSSVNTDTHSGTNSCSCTIYDDHECKWDLIKDDLKKLKEDLTEVSTDRDDLLRLIKDKDSELGEYSAKIESLKDNNGKQNKTFADDYLRKIKEEKQKKHGSCYENRLPIKNARKNGISPPDKRRVSHRKKRNHFRPKKYK